ncbi:hypothetical protein [Geminisphaera colitermitum]|uniref:hypothetical protein n=1 Tax=Geminisphaera colitermitum TaxID=1148786 RepID=UPI0012FEF7F5|nr:hypothetical protein [Geminisphaera colitermitum]
MPHSHLFGRFFVMYFTILLAAACGNAGQEGRWLIYDGFDYRSPALDGCDGGIGAWKTEWHRSAAGGVALVEPGFDFNGSGRWRLASAGRRAEIRSKVTAGSYRDFNYPETEEQATGKAVFWLSFLARAEGAPFDVSADEMSLQLRAEKDVPLLTIGVMGRLNEWRIRAEGLSRHFSRGAEKRPPESLAWIVVRVDVDSAPDASDAVHLWVNPSGLNEPSVARPNARIIGKDIWDAKHPFSPMRLRIGTISSTKEGAEKCFSWDEIRMGRSFADVAPVSAPPDE